MGGLFTDACLGLCSYTGAMIKILLVDDDPNIRRGVRMLLALEHDFSFVGEAGDGWETLALARELQPDVVVMDIRLPGLDGLSAAERLLASQPHCAVIVLTLYDEPANRRRAEQIGVAAFIGKQKTDGELVNAIRSTTLEMKKGDQK
jgi:DNA-binding NarL/FixJ family response regulator